MYAGVSRTRIVSIDGVHCLKSGTYIAAAINVHAFPYRGNNEGTQIERNARAETRHNVCVPPFTGPRRRQEPMDIIFILNINRVFYDPGKIKTSDDILHSLRRARFRALLFTRYVSFDLRYHAVLLRSVWRILPFALWGKVYALLLH